MKKRVEQSAESEAFRRLLSSKVDPSPRFTKEERTIIAQYQNSLMDALLEEDRSALMRDMEKPLALLRSGASDDALQHALKDIRPGTGLRPREQTSVRTARMVHASKILDLCNGYLTQPPYQSGFPLVEEAGRVVVGSTGPTNLRTFSWLSRPAEGALSVGVSMGDSPEDTIHPVKEVHHGIEESYAYANLEFYVFAQQFPSIADGGTMTVTADFTVPLRSPDVFAVSSGEVSSIWAKPIHRIAVDEVDETCTVAVSAKATLALLGSESSQASVGSDFFLRALKGGGKPTPPDGPHHNLSISETLPLAKGTRGVGIIVSAMLYVVRQNFEKGQVGYGAIDLRSPVHSKYRVDQCLEAGGPISVPTISLVICPRQELARYGPGYIVPSRDHVQGQV